MPGRPSWQDDDDFGLIVFAGRWKAPTHPPEHAPEEVPLARGPPALYTWEGSPVSSLHTLQLHQHCAPGDQGLHLHLEPGVPH